MLTSGATELGACAVSGDHNVLNLEIDPDNFCEGELAEAFGDVPNSSDDAGYGLEYASIFLGDLPERYV